MSEIHKTKLNKLVNIINKNTEKTKSLSSDVNMQKTLAISVTILQEYYKVSIDDAIDSLTDGPNDCKIDAFYYDDTDKISDLVLIQSKYRETNGDSSTFSEDDINLAIKNTSDIITGLDLYNPNDSLKNKLNSYRELLKENDNPSINVTLIFATNGLIADNLKELSSVLKAKTKKIKIQFIDASCFGLKTPEVVKETLKINTKDLSKEIEQTDIIFNNNGLICSTTIYNLMSFYEKAGKDNLFCDNVRYKLKKSNINNEILKSFKNNPNNFCFLNNGIYIACSDFSVESTGASINNLTIENPRIINGAQTTGTLYELFEQDKTNELFNKASIIIRVFKINESLNILDITKATNSQNPIDIVDLEANNKYQNIIKENFSKNGIGLIVKEGEDLFYFNDTISNEELLQIYTAIYEEEPALAKNSKMSVFKKYFDIVFSETSIHNNIFNKLFRCYELVKFLHDKKENLKNDKEKLSLIKNSWYSTMYTMVKIEPKILDLNIPFNNESKNFYEAAFIKSTTIINEIIETQRNLEGNGFSQNKLFKGSSIKNLIDTKIKILQDTDNN